MSMDKLHYSFDKLVYEKRRIKRTLSTMYKGKKLENLCKQVDETFWPAVQLIATIIIKQQK
jgi:hypothetical protein